MPYNPGVRLNPTPASLLCDGLGRPYYLWDTDTTLEELHALLEHDSPEVRAYWLGKVMRQARPDDVLTLVAPDRIAASWPDVRRYLGRSRPFWEWLLRRWGYRIDEQPA